MVGSTAHAISGGGSGGQPEVDKRTSKNDTINRRVGATLGGPWRRGDVAEQLTSQGRLAMEKYEFKVNGETLFSEEQSVDAAVLLQLAYAGKAVGEDPDKTGYVLRVPDSDVTFVSGQVVDLDKYNVFRAAPEKGAPFA